MISRFRLIVSNVSYCDGRTVRIKIQDNEMLTRNVCKVEYVWFRSRQCRVDPMRPAHYPLSEFRKNQRIYVEWGSLRQESLILVNRAPGF